MKIKILKEAADKTVELEPRNQTLRAKSTWRDDELEPVGHSGLAGDTADDDSSLSYYDDSEEEPPTHNFPFQGSSPEAVLAAKGFENIKRLGSGMVGSVYSADWHSGLEVAVKVVPIFTFT